MTLADVDMDISESMNFANNFLLYSGMAKRIQSVIVDDIINFIDKINGYTADLSYQEFAARAMVVDACLHNVHIIGEAISQLKEETRQKAESIPWNLISGMTGRLVGEDLEADPEPVWHVITTALPELKHKLERLHKRLTARNL